MWNCRALSGFVEESRTETELTLLWRVEGPFFEGHFPGNPVLPAVAVIEVTLEVLRRYCAEKGDLKSIPKAKFTGVIQPSEEVRIYIQRGPKGWRAQWSGLDSQGQGQPKAELMVELG